MWKTIAKVFTVFVLVAALFGAFDVAINPTTGVSADSGVTQGFSLGIVQSVAAGCPDNGSTSGCEGGDGGS